MDTSVLLARLLGPLFVVIGVGAVLNRAYYRDMIASFFKDPALYYFSGALAFVTGVAILAFHNVWVADWRVMITVIGWLSLVKGGLRLLIPRIGAGWVANPRFLAGALVASVVFSILVGGALSYFAFAG